MKHHCSSTVIGSYELCQDQIIQMKTIKNIKMNVKGVNTSTKRQFSMLPIQVLFLIVILSPTYHCFSVRGFAQAATPEGVSGQSLDPSRIYQYSYEAEVELNEADLPQDSKIHTQHADVGVRINAVVELIVRWTNPDNKYDQVIEMRFDGAEVFNVSDKERRDPSFYVTRNSVSLRTVTKPIIFRWSNGYIQEFYVSSEETITSLNIKRGILGFFQIQTQSGDRVEEDLSGKCNVTYDVEGTEVKKVKDISSCVNDEEGFSTMSKVLGVSSDSTSQGLYTMSPDKSHIVYGVNLESHSIRVNVRQEISLYSLGRQKLGLLSIDKIKSITSSTKDEALKSFAKEKRKSGEKYIRASLLSERDVKNCAEGCLDVLQIISDLSKQLSKVNMANISSAQAYITAVRAARQADKDTLMQLLKLKEFKDIQFTIVDILATAQTDASQAALIDFLDFKNKEKEGLVERALTGIAFSSHPSENVLRDLYKLYKGEIASPKVRQTVGLAMGAVLKKFCASAPGNCQREIPKKVTNLIHQGFMESTTEDTQNLYILIARNTGQPEFINKLVNLAEHSKFYLVCHHALTALTVFDTKDFGEEFRDTMNRIYHQNLKKYDNTIRAAAANRLLSNAPTEMDVKNLILSLPDQTSKELSNFIYQRIFDLIKTNHPSKEILQKVLKDNTVSNYWTMANSGMASAFTGYLFSTDDSQVTYGLFMEYTNAGMMRRTASDFTLHSQGHSIALTEAGIVVQGLESLTGSEPDKGEEEYDSMVGMSSIMMGVKLRPLTFFRGYGDMMSLIWQGSSGEPEGVEAMLMLMDYLQHIPMASGLRVKAEVLGAISTKISVAIEFSLWSRTVEITTTNGGAFSIQCRLSLESPIVRASVRHQGDAQSSIDFSVFTDFSSLPPKSCIRISYPDFIFTKSLRKFEKVKGSNKKLLTLSKRKSNNFGRSLPLQPGNSIMCTKITK
uniref:microsomal triglyceride transfer protein-like isoform X1 n=1 Tax=Styela clava TaxID=7725 RepID=UPI001939B6D6|nr:microsomal triglyceride transfer protein-like isoform X1 [Styela clava]